MIGIRSVRTDDDEPVTQRDQVHFVGDRFQVTDDPTAEETILTIVPEESAIPLAITPPTITSDEALYTPEGIDTATLVRLTVSGDHAILGLVAPTLIGDPRKTLALLGGDGTLELRHMSDDTSAAARFVCPFGASYYLGNFGSIDILYDNALAVWRLIP